MKFITVKSKETTVSVDLVPPLVLGDKQRVSLVDIWIPEQYFEFTKDQEIGGGVDGKEPKMINFATYLGKYNARRLQQVIEDKRRSEVIGLEISITDKAAYLTTQSKGVLVSGELTKNFNIPRILKPYRRIDELCKRVSCAIGALKRLRPFVSEATAIQIYRALVLPYFDYCSAVWDGLCNRLADKVQKLQNRAARVILKAKYDTSSSILRNRLSWDTLAIRRKKQKAVLMYKCLNGLVPNYLQNLFTHRCTSYNLRNQEYKITLPKPRTDFLKRSFSYSGAKLWNDLPLSIRSSSSLAKFKREINLIFWWLVPHTAVM